MSAKLVLRLEWNEIVRSRRDPFDTEQFSNLSTEILVEWIAPHGFCDMFSFQLNRRRRVQRQTNPRQQFCLVGGSKTAIDQVLSCYPCDVSFSITDLQDSIVDHLELLGVTIDNSLIFSKHIGNIIKKVGNQLDVLSRLKNKLSISYTFLVTDISIIVLLWVRNQPH